MLSNEAVTETTPEGHFLFFFFYYLLPKKKKMFYHKSHWNVLLKKKIYLYFSHFFCFFFPPFFSSSFSANVSLYSTKNKTFFFLPFFFFPKSGTSVGRRVPTSVSPNQKKQKQKTKQTNKQKKMHNEIRNSQLPFWFHKLIQSHMCYTGLELEHCKLFTWVLLFFNSWLQERTGNWNDMIRISPTYCFFVLSVMLLSSFLFRIFRGFTQKWGTHRV